MFLLIGNVVLLINSQWHSFNQTRVWLQLRNMGSYSLLNHSKQKVYRIVSTLIVSDVKTARWFPSSLWDVTLLVKRQTTTSALSKSNRPTGGTCTSSSWQLNLTWSMTGIKHAQFTWSTGRWLMGRWRKQERFAPTLWWSWTEIASQGARLSMIRTSTPLMDSEYNLHVYFLRGVVWHCLVLR